MKRIAWFSIIGVAAVIVTGGASPAFAAVPVNDLISNATAISALPYTDSSNTAEATSTGEPTDCMTAPAIWYKYQPTATMGVEANTIDSGFDTKLAMYQGKPGSHSKAITCNDDQGASTSAVVAYLNPKYTYYFMVGGYGVETGSTVFRLEQYSTVPVVGFTVSATVDASGTVNVSGTLTCDVNTLGTLTDVSLSQSFRDGTWAYGSMSTSVECGAADRSFSGTVSSGNAEKAFQRGQIEFRAWGWYATIDVPSLVITQWKTVRVPLAR
jgi:hypothetical protein